MPPLLRGQAYEVSQVIPPGSSKDDSVFVIKVTGEVVATYEEYAEKQELYRSRLWVCARTGREGLTYVEAQQSEQGQQVSNSALACNSWSMRMGWSRAA